MNIFKTIFILLVITSSLSAQGWERAYSIDGSVRKIVPSSDGGTAAIGSIKIGSGSFIHLKKIDIDGQLQWNKTYGSGSSSGWDIKSTTDGGYILLALESLPGQRSFQVIKIDVAGNQEWELLHPMSTAPYNKGSINLTQDGGYAVSGTPSNNFFLFKIDANGVFQWEYTDVSASIERSFDIIATSDNSLAIIGRTSFNNNDGKLLIIDSVGNKVLQKLYGDNERQDLNSVARALDGGLMMAGLYESATDTNIIDGFDIWLVKTDSVGNLLWSKTLPIPGGQSFVTDIATTPDGGFAMVTVNNLPGLNTHGLVIKTNALGDVLWTKIISHPVGFIDLYGVTISLDGFIVVSGNREIDLDEEEYYLKLSQNGEIHTSNLIGNIANDSNNNCSIDSIEQGLQNWMVEAKGAQTFYDITDSNGNYSIGLDSGSYILSVIPPNNLWLPCQNAQTIVVQLFDTTYTDFPIQSSEDCISLTVDISTPFLRRCFDNTYTVNYCNQGTIPSPNSYIEIEFDQYLIVDSSSIPWTSQTGHLYTFPIGNLNVNECGSFKIHVTVDCDSTVLGQTHCVEAHAYPDFICVPSGSGWDGSITSLDVTCAPDSITFIIENTGLDMIAPQDFVIIEDNIIMKNGFFLLASSEVLLIKVPSNGSTYRLYADQAPGYFPPSYNPTIAIEGCGINPSTQQFSIGFITSFSEDDVLDYISIDCKENIGSFDPNDKQAEPKGYGAEHYIEVGDDLEYHIRFQNTGTDTAFTVAIRDTLSDHLDVSSVIPGSSSHSYDFQIINGKVLKFVFNNILLVDSTTNESGSHGFVKFRISQEDNLPLGTIINNSAAIFFDFNEPIITNETFHKIGENFIDVIASNADLQEYPSLNINVQPNPFVDQADFVLENAPQGLKTFALYNTNGVLLKEDHFQDDTLYRFERENLISGIYFYTIRQDQQLLGTGKVVVH